MRRFAVGDLHGQWDALRSVLRQVEFDKARDHLTVLGDIFDYGTETCKIIDFLLETPNRIVIRGNHDEVFRHWVLTGTHLYNWSHGGSGTLRSYAQYLENDFNFGSNMMHRGDIPARHLNFLNEMRDYHITEDNILFCHAGFNMDYSFEDQLGDEFYNNRCLYKRVRKGELPTCGFKKIFIGHTITQTHQPFVSDLLVNLDTGAKAPERPLTLMNIDTEEYVQSYLKNF